MSRRGFSMKMAGTLAAVACILTTGGQAAYSPTSKSTGHSPATATASRPISRMASTPAASVPASAPVSAPAMPLNPDKLEFNFHGVPLDTVLDYLSRAGGFIIIKQTDVSGRVDIVSHQSLTRDEAVNLLNTVLNEKGYAAIRNERTLTIVTRDEARQRNIPVKVGNNPADIPKTDEMVTQIIPVRHANAQTLIDSIKDLLPSYATLTADTSSNALVLTDTQAGVRRIAEIVQALDQSISSISQLKVFRLKYADAKDTATLIENIFPAPSSSSSSSGRSSGSPFEEMISRFRGGGPGGPGGDLGGGPGGGSGRGSSSSSSDSAALKASSHVTAEADQETNSVVVSAPDELMPTIEQLVQSVDQSPDVDTLVRVFPLRYADATDMATNITNVFGQGGAGQAQNSSSSGRSGFSPFSFMFGGGMGGGMGGSSRSGRGGGGRSSSSGGSSGSSSSADLSQRKLAQQTVLAVADTRTNSVIVSAATEVMEQVASVISSLDQNSARAKHVYTYQLRNADPQQTTAMLQQMFSSGTSGSSTVRSTTSTGTNNTTNRNSNSSSNNMGFNLGGSSSGMGSRGGGGGGGGF